MTSIVEPIKEVVLSITFDNGKEFTAREVIVSILGCETYFAKSYNSWGRGQNKNANGLLRQYFHKSRQLNDIEVVEVLDAIDKLNSRSRKYLGSRTPYEAF
ncbi:IS30 family transposase [Thorsellia anophelis]|uniref:Transposase, IS30 family n=1 Tax=Thorsellia anophelis DSM 18579 TaxID=1123402 RepID=A0A1I0FEJ1_9GAMM|nr:IS30 family transposase [Thorsellia anophelis]SET56592.1 transposase, IS30 family [Thorsellia anophelis DSM 18579]